MSSLAAQLQGIASLDATRLTSKYGAPSSKSYLFPPSIANQHDLDSIFALGQSGFEELLSLDQGMGEYELDLFSEKAKRTDRMMLTPSEDEELGLVSDRCLRRLGKWIGIMAGGKCIEWLVRRFRVHEMNASTLLQVFLPYHESPNFPRILSILSIPQTSPYHVPFSALIKTPSQIPRTFITSSISPSRDKSLHLLNDVAGLVQQAVKEDVVHRALLTFWSATMVDLLDSTRKAGGTPHESMVKLLVETFVILLSTPQAGEDINAAVYPPLVLLTRSISLADGPFHVIVSALLTPDSGANSSQRILTLLVILNDRQGYTEGLGDDATTHFSKIKQLGEVLVAAMAKYGFENAFKVVLPVLLERPDLHFKALKAILDIRTLPDSLARITASNLLYLGSSTISEPIKLSCKSLLANLRERHPSIVDSVYVEAVGKEDIDQALIQKPSEEVAFLNIYSADITSRVQGIREILSGHVDATSTQALIARLGDTEEAVLDALYEDSARLLEIISVEQYISGIKPIFRSVSPKPSIIGRHFDFISASLLVVKNANTATLVFRELLFPSFLSTEKRQPFTKAEALKLLEGGFQNVEILGAIGTEITKARGENAKGGAERSNLLIAKALAEGFTKSSDLNDETTFLVSQLDATLPSARLLAYLVLGQLVFTLRGPKQISLAVKLLHHLATRRDGATFRTLQDTEDPFSSTYLEAIYRKSSEEKTTQRAIISILSTMTKVTQSPSEHTVWLSSDRCSSDKDAFRSFAQEVYLWANSGTLPTALAQNLLRSLLTQLGEDALLFFASVWTAPASPTPLRAASLRHTSAFIAAYAGVAEQGTGIDFQIVLPALLVALQDSEKVVRFAAVEVLRAISEPIEGNANIYALDTIYGDMSEGVQLLKPSDRKKYLDALVQVADEIVIDPKRVQAVHTAALGVQPGRNRKDSSHRRAVIGCLTSHLVSHRSYCDRVVLLQTLLGVHDAAIIRGTLPLLSSLIEPGSDESVWLSKLSNDHRDIYLDLLFGGIRAQSVNVFTEEQSSAWSFLLSILTSGEGIQAQLRSLSLGRMVDGIFAALPVALKVDYVLTLIQSLQALPVDDVLSSKKALEQFDLDSETIIEIIETFSEPLETTLHRKKQRQDDGGNADEDRPTQAVSDLTTLIESRDWKNLPGDAQLVATLMSILSSLLARRQAIREGVDYLEQEVLGAILTLVEKIQDATEVQRAHIGIEVIIKVIRASTNPRTSQRALLVASELARLIPEAVLHNVMPIFTFMGASDFQRDDAYSFGVVEKTVSRIVPVMTKELKDKSASKLELYNESLTFLSIFTDMAGRLPKHRVLPFFVHLVKSLGPADFLAPVCMLLVDRATTKNGRSGSSIASVLELPAGLAAAFDVSVRTQVLLDIVNEFSRLVADLTRSEKEAFLSRTISVNDAADRSLKQITHLVTLFRSLLAQLQGKKCSQAPITQLVVHLVVLSSSTNQTIMASTDLPMSMQAALEGGIQLLAAENFLVIVPELLGASRENIINLALEIFTERLPLIKPEIRIKSSAALGKIIAKTATLLSSTSAPSIVSAALSAIWAVAKSATSAEDGPLAGVILPVIGVIGKGDNANVIEALSLIESLIRHLSSRVIPFIQPIIDTSLTLIRSSKATSPSSSFTVLKALVETVSTFISSKQLTAILSTAFDHKGKDEALTLSLLTSIAKKVRTKSLFPILMGIWKSAEQEDEGAMTAFFEMLRLTLKNATREDLPSMLKPVFAFFLDVFDLRHRLQQKSFDANVVDAIEGSAIGSFLELVTKLNEGTFKPLFVRLYDWAVVDLADGKDISDSRLIERKIVLLHVMKGLLNKFKNLLSPYLSILQTHIDELLDAYAAKEITSYPLWKLLLEVLGLSFEVDEGAYWTDASLIKLVPLLVQQIPLFPSSADSNVLQEGEEGLSPITSTLCSLVSSTSSEPLLKKINTSVLLLTRSDDISTRLQALDVLNGLWSLDNEKTEDLVAFVPETVGEFLSELLEDESLQVENKARGVLAKIERITGSLAEYLE